jgi:beta-lactamase superfamily II metal-dependent hydrolase
VNVGTLSDNELHVIVVGPGSGETIAIRVPSGRWIIIDSLARVQARETLVPALELVREYGGDVACVVLTHPHHDHAVGFSALVGRARKGIIGCVVSAIDNPTRWSHLQDADEQRRRGAVESALSAIQTAWDENPVSKWELEAGTSRDVEDVTLNVLWPTAEVAARYRKRPPRDPNRLSASLLAVWNSTRIIIGADVLDVDWREIAKQAHTPPLADHDALKVSHHGSRKDQHSCVTAGSNDRVWIVTPWTGKGGLPRFENGGGVEHLLTCVREIQVTSIPGLPSTEPNPIKRRDVIKARDRSRFGPLVLESQAEGPFSDAWVVASFQSGAAPPTVRVGQGARTVVP